MNVWKGLLVGKVWKCFVTKGDSSRPLESVERVMKKGNENLLSHVLLEEGRKKKCCRVTPMHAWFGTTDMRRRAHSFLFASQPLFPLFSLYSGEIYLESNYFLGSQDPGREHFLSYTCDSIPRPSFTSSSLALEFHALKPWLTFSTLSGIKIHLFLFHRGSHLVLDKL